MKEEKLHRAINYPYLKEYESFVYYSGDSFPISTSYNNCYALEGNIRGNDYFFSKKLEGKIDFDEINNRKLVLAYGSNGSLEQLRRKFGSLGNDVIPVIKCDVENIDVVYSAHITKYGSLPATLQGSPGTKTSIFATLLNDDQLRQMHKTEAVGIAYNFVKFKDLKIDFGAKFLEEDVYSYLSIAGCFAHNLNEAALKSIKAVNRHFVDLIELEVLQLVKILLTGNDNDFEAFVLSNTENNDIRVKHNMQLKAFSKNYSYMNFEVVYE